MPKHWSHTTLDAVPPSLPVDVRVAMPVMRGVKVMLHYRKAGQANFVAVEMRRRGPEKVARIPADAVDGTSLQYYIEARTSSGALVKNSASAIDPNIVLIETDARPQLITGSAPAAAQAPEENETAEATPAALNPDEEKAPLTGSVAPRPVTKKPPKVRAKREVGPSLRKAQLAGYILLGAGALVGIVGGGAGLGLAAQYSDSVVRDACPNGSNCPNPRTPYTFGDAGEGASSSSNDAAFQSAGLTADALGGVALGLGAAMVAAGAITLIVDHLQQRGSTEAKTARSDDEAAARARFVAAPMVGRDGAGVGIGGSF